MKTKQSRLSLVPVLGVLLLSAVASAETYDFQIQLVGPGGGYAGRTVYFTALLSYNGAPGIINFRSAQLGGRTVALQVLCGANVCSTDASNAFTVYPGTPTDFSVAIPQDTAAGPNTLTISADSQGAAHVFSAPLRVDVPPSPLPPVSNLPSIAIPILASWQSAMLKLAPVWCPTGQLDFGDEQEVWYYDGARNYFQIADYTGNKNWETCAYAVANQYRDYILSANGGLPGWRIFTTGLRMAYERSGDASYQQALILLSHNAAFADRGGAVDDQYIRETAYVLDAYVNAERAGAPRNPQLSHGAANLLGQFDRLFVSGNYSVNQLFYDGLGAEALIHYYELTSDPAVPAAIKRMLDWVWTSGYSIGLHQMVYNPDPPGPTCQVGCQTYATDFINMVVPAFAWYWRVTGNSAYQQEGDEIFSHSLDTDISYSGKVFNQNFRWTYVAYRTVGTQTPPIESPPVVSPPVPAPPPVTPPPPPPPTGLTSFSCSPLHLSAEQTASCTFTLASGAARGGASVSISLSSDSVDAPPLISVPEAAVSGTFDITAGWTCVSTPVTLTATLMGNPDGSAKAATTVVVDPTCFFITW